MHFAPLAGVQAGRQAPRGAARSTGADHHGVAAGGEGRGDMPADEACAAEDQGCHGIDSVISVLTEIYVGSSLRSRTRMAQPAKIPVDPLTETLGSVGHRFVLHWGEMGWRW